MREHDGRPAARLAGAATTLRQSPDERHGWAFASSTPVDPDEIMRRATEMIGAAAAVAHACGAGDPRSHHEYGHHSCRDVGDSARVSLHLTVRRSASAPLRLIRGRPHVDIVGELGQVLPAQHEHAGVVTALRADMISSSLALSTTHLDSSDSGRSERG